MKYDAIYIKNLLNIYSAYKIINVIDFYQSIRKYLLIFISNIQNVKVVIK